MLLRDFPGAEGDKGAYYCKINILPRWDSNSVSRSLLSGGGCLRRPGEPSTELCVQGVTMGSGKKQFMPQLSKPFPCREGKKEGVASRGAGVAKGLQLSQLQGLGWWFPLSQHITCGYLVPIPVPCFPSCWCTWPEKAVCPFLRHRQPSRGVWT